VLQVSEGLTWHQSSQQSIRARVMSAGCSGRAYNGVPSARKRQMALLSSSGPCGVSSTGTCTTTMVTLSLHKNIDRCKLPHDPCYMCKHAGGINMHSLLHMLLMAYLRDGLPCMCSCIVLNSTCAR